MAYTSGDDSIKGADIAAWARATLGPQASNEGVDFDLVKVDDAHPFVTSWREGLYGFELVEAESVQYGHSKWLPLSTALYAGRDGFVGWQFAQVIEGLGKPTLIRITGRRPGGPDSVRYRIFWPVLVKDGDLDEKVELAGGSVVYTRAETSTYGRMVHSALWAEFNLSYTQVSQILRAAGPGNAFLAVQLAERARSQLGGEAGKRLRGILNGLPKRGQAPGVRPPLANADHLSAALTQLGTLRVVWEVSELHSLRQQLVGAIARLNQPPPIGARVPSALNLGALHRDR